MDKYAKKLQYAKNAKKKAPVIPKVKKAEVKKTESKK